MPPAGFELAIPASERPQTHAVDSAATGIGVSVTVQVILKLVCNNLLTYSMEQSPS